MTLKSVLATGCFAASFATLLAGCSVGPDYQRPETPAPQAWAERNAAATPWPSMTWWQDFASPPLNAFMEEAQRTNFDIGAAMARVRQAEAQVKIAGASLFPAVAAGGGAARNRSIATTPNSGGSPVGTNTYNAVLSASYELDFWGKYADARDAAVAVAQATRFDQQTTALTIEANVANTYFAIAALQDRLAVARNNLTIAETTLDAIRARVSAGTASGLDIAEQESVVAEQRAALPPLTQQLKQNVYTLAILTGKLPETVAVPAGGLAASTLPAVAAGLPSGLLARRPDVQFAEAQLVAANANIKAAKAALFPDISLTAQGGLESAALSKILDPASVLYSLAASVSQPIFEGGALEGNIELQQARYDELVQNYRKSVVSAFGDVENALAAVDYGTQQEAAQKVAVETAQRAYEIAQAQLYTGTIDIITMLNIQRTLFQAEDLLVQVKLAHAQAVVSLFRALGGGWEVGV